MSAAEKTFERTDYGVGVLTRVRVYHEIGVRWLAIYGGRETAIVESCDVAVQEGDAFVLFVFNRELNTRMNFIQAGEIVFDDFEACKWLATKDGEYVVDIFFYEFWKAMVFLSGDFCCFFECMCHPKIGDCRHER